MRLHNTVVKAKHRLRMESMRQEVLICVCRVCVQAYTELIHSGTFLQGLLQPYLPRHRSYVTWLFLMLTAQKSLKQKNSEKNCIPGQGFSLFIFASGLSPCNNLLTYYATSAKNPKIQVI
jgi:hypothetical protein